MNVESDLAFEWQTLRENILQVQALSWEAEDLLFLLLLLLFDMQLEPMFYVFGLETSATSELECQLAWNEK